MIPFGRRAYNTTFMEDRHQALVRDLERNDVGQL
jgi:hypothetical protein